MHKTTTLLAAAAVALTAACSATTTTAASTPTSHAAASSHPAPKPTPTATRTTTRNCNPTRDLLVRYITPGGPATAQALGNYNIATCETTLQWLQQTAPTDTGYCTQAAWASDNPGYNPDAEPAPPLKKVLLAVGPAC